MEISNADSATVASLCTVTTTLASSAGGLSALYFDAFIEYYKNDELSYDITMALNGCLSGLVAITAGCAVVTPWASIIIGFVAGILFYVVQNLLIKMRIDDVVCAVPVHMANGIWGLLAVGFFAEQDLLKLAGYNSSHYGLLYRGGDGTRLAAQLVAVIWITVFASFCALACFSILKEYDMFRVHPDVELSGLDIFQLGGLAYDIGGNHEGGEYHNDEMDGTSDVTPEDVAATTPEEDEVRGEVDKPEEKYDEAEEL